MHFGRKKHKLAILFSRKSFSPAAFALERTWCIELGIGFKKP